MYHTACKVEFQPFKRLYSQLTFSTFYEKSKKTSVVRLVLESMNLLVGSLIDVALGGVRAVSCFSGLQCIYTRAQVAGTPRVAQCGLEKVIVETLNNARHH